MFVSKIHSSYTLLMLDATAVFLLMGWDVYMTSLTAQESAFSKSVLVRVKYTMVKHCNNVSVHVNFPETLY